MNVEGEMLARICAFIVKKQFVVGDLKSIKDMVQRYEHPPFTIAYPVCMRMTMLDNDELGELLKQAHDLLTANEAQPV